MLNLNSLICPLIIVCFLLMGAKICCQTEWYRGTIETKKFYTQKLVDIPFDIAAMSRLHNLLPSELDTLYERFTICGDTIISEIYSINHLLEVTSVQIRKDLFFRYKKSEEFLKFKPMPGFGLQFKKENWKKVKTQKRKKEYDYLVISPYNKTMRYYMSIDDANQYHDQLGLQSLFAYTFNPFGTYHKVKKVDEGGESVRLYQYKPDPNCTCIQVMKNFKLDGLDEIDADILPAQTFSYEIISTEERTALPHFAVDDQLGQCFDQKDLLGKPSYIAFWATWCKPCLAEIPYLKYIYEEYRTRGLQVVSISLDKFENDDLWVDKTKERAMNWTNWIYMMASTQRLQKH